jgi:hypothetical protein
MSKKYNIKENDLLELDLDEYTLEELFLKYKIHPSSDKKELFEKEIRKRLNNTDIDKLIDQIYIDKLETSPYAKKIHIRNGNDIFKIPNVLNFYIVPMGYNFDETDLSIGVFKLNISSKTEIFTTKYANLYIDISPSFYKSDPIKENDEYTESRNRVENILKSINQKIDVQKPEKFRIMRIIARRNLWLDTLFSRMRFIINSDYWINVLYKDIFDDKFNLIGSQKEIEISVNEIKQVSIDEDSHRYVSRIDLETRGKIPNLINLDHFKY